MTKRAFSIDQIEHTRLIAALGAVSSIFGYSIAHLIFFEALVMWMIGGPDASPAFTEEVREAMGVSFLGCGIPLLAILAFSAYLKLQKRRNIQTSTIFDTGLIVAIAFLLGFLVYVPFQVFFMIAWAF
jgi:hypothetical protein